MKAVGIGRKAHVAEDATAAKMDFDARDRLEIAARDPERLMDAAQKLMPLVCDHGSLSLSAHSARQTGHFLSIQSASGRFDESASTWTTGVPRRVNPGRQGVSSVQKKVSSSCISSARSRAHSPPQ